MQCLVKKNGIPVKKHSPQADLRRAENVKRIKFRTSFLNTPIESMAV